MSQRINYSSITMIFKAVIIATVQIVCLGCETAENKLHVGVQSPASHLRVRVSLDLLPDYRNIIVYNGVNRFHIPNGYGENDWRIYLNDSLLAKFRHIKTNRNNGHEYHFFVFQYAGKWFVDVDIRGTDAVQRRIEFTRPDVIK
jgi:hypothetical protein